MIAGESSFGFIELFQTVAISETGSADCGMSPRNRNVQKLRASNTLSSSVTKIECSDSGGRKSEGRLCR